MTVIAAKAYIDRFEIAADRLFTAEDGSRVKKLGSKLFAVGDCVFALTGRMDYYELFEEFIASRQIRSWASLPVFTARDVRRLGKDFAAYCASELSLDKMELFAWVILTPDAMFSVILPDASVITKTEAFETLCQGSIDVAPEAVMLFGGSPADACRISAQMYTFIGENFDVATVYRRGCNSEYLFTTCTDSDS